MPGLPGSLSPERAPQVAGTPCTFARDEHRAQITPASSSPRSRDPRRDRAARRPRSPPSATTSPTRSAGRRSAYRAGVRRRRRQRRPGDPRQPVPVHPADLGVEVHRRGAGRSPRRSSTSTPPTPARCAARSPPGRRPGSTPYGTCTGAQLHGLLVAVRLGAGAEQRGRRLHARRAASAAVDGRASSYTWWLDVETAQHVAVRLAADALARNRATLEGMTACLVGAGRPVGLYSTGQQWAPIVGTIPATQQPRAARNSWLPGGDARSPARRRTAPSPRWPRAAA